MSGASPIQVPVDRAIRTDEIAVIRATLKRAPSVERAERLAEGLAGLRVVARCGCGCASVDFASPEADSDARPVADGIGSGPAGGDIGVLVWATEHRVIGLEVYDLGCGAEGPPLPDPNTIRPFPRSGPTG